MRHRIKKTHSMREETSVSRIRTLKYHSKILHSGNGAYFYKDRRGSSSMLKAVPLAVVSLALLLVLGLMMCPTQINEVVALEDEGIDTQSVTVPTNGVALAIDSTLPENNTVEEQVSGSGTHYISVDFSVGANNVKQYQVFVQAESNTLTGKSSGDQIRSIGTEGTAAGSIGAKQWGYNVAKGASIAPSSLTYNPIQTGVTKPADTVAATSGTLTNVNQPYTLAFAANLDGAKADHYKSNITLSVAASAEGTNLLFNGIETMQEMNMSVCQRANEGDTIQLRDTRDNKLYWIAKLRDGNCWMTQNLDYDGGGVRVIILKDDWNGWASNTTTGNYYDPGLYIKNDPLNVAVCNVSSSFEECVASGWTKIPSIDSTELDTHYLIGNYYDKKAIINGICPSEWRIPYGGRDVNVAGTYTYLLRQYGIQNTLTGTVDDNQYNVVLNPFYFLRGGWIGYNGISDVGSKAYYYTSANMNGDFYFDTSKLNTEDANNDWSGVAGFSVRCFVPGA